MNALLIYKFIGKPARLGPNRTYVERLIKVHLLDRFCYKLSGSREQNPLAQWIVYIGEVCKRNRRRNGHSTWVAQQSTIISICIASPKVTKTSTIMTCILLSAALSR